MTEKRYKEEVAEIATLDPSNIFLRSLRTGRGDSSASVAYLSAAWKIVREKTANTTSNEANGTATPDKAPTPEAVNDLFRRKGHLHREMCATKCNALMTATTVAERKRVMRQLDEKQSEWATIQQQIRLWDNFKQIPTPLSIIHNADASLQERLANLDKLTDLELAAKLNTARGSHSRKKAQIEKFAPSVMEEKHPQHKQWVKAETALKEYEREKLHIETEIKRRKEAAKENG
jgi:hypothetical protein